ncbi:MAG: nodulation protein NfeD [Bdellovibrionales bacterium]|nr:nodulation protein NfeD [Bdellovibrionales bacterium]
MKALFLILFFLFGLKVHSAPQLPSAPSLKKIELDEAFGHKPTCTLSIEIRDVVGPATYDYLQRAEKQAKTKNCSSILVRLNTPGGSLQSTRKIIEQIMSSDIPYLCLIHPSGGHAGSAGAIIMQACHVSGAMEATNIGAASPIASTGQEIPEDLKKKLFEDTRSWVEGLAKYHNRNVEFARNIVMEAKALDAEEAVNQNAIDVLVKSIDEFLDFAKGREVKLSEEKISKVVVGDLITYDPDLRHDVLQILSNPQWAYLIFMGSLGLLYFELTHPGALVPGVVGAIGLVISLMNFHMLDVSWGGVVLIILGVGFMFAELFVPSFGALGIGGLAAFVAGSLFLFDGSAAGYALPKTLIFSTSLVLFLMMMGLSWLALGAMRSGQRRRKKENWVGQEVIIKEFDPNKKRGMAFHHGELWKIKSHDRFEIDDKARITKVSGLTLFVEKV